MQTKDRQNRSLPPGLEWLGGLRHAQDRREAAETIGRAFGHPADMEDNLHNGLWRGSIFNPEHTRIAVADGRVVSAVVMGPRRIRFGPISVPAMTLGPVATHDRYSKKGYAAATMKEATQYMQVSGFRLAYLHGIQNFYYRFGYYPFRTPCQSTFKRESAEKESLPGRLRSMNRSDLPQVRRIYNAVTAGRTCTADRDNVVWDWLIGPGRRTGRFREPKVILDERGMIRGYLVMNLTGQPIARECVVRQDEASCRATLGALVRESRRRESSEIKVYLPWDDHFGVFLRQFIGAEFTMNTNPDGGNLMKVVNFPALMKEIEPLFAQRLRAATVRQPRTKFSIRSEIGAVGLTLGGRSIRIGDPLQNCPAVRIPQRWLSGLLSGYYSIDEIPARGTKVPASLKPLMRILFPTGWPWVNQGDDY